MGASCIGDSKLPCLARPVFCNLGTVLLLCLATQELSCYYVLQLRDCLATVSCKICVLQLKNCLVTMSFNSEHGQFNAWTASKQKCHCCSVSELVRIQLLLETEWALHSSSSLKTEPSSATHSDTFHFKGDLKSLKTMLRMYLCCHLYTLYLHACQVRVTVGDWNNFDDQFRDGPLIMTERRKKTTCWD